MVDKIWRILGAHESSVNGICLLGSAKSTTLKNLPWGEMNPGVLELLLGLESSHTCYTNFMDLQIVKKIALVTGASQGIGFAVAQSLAAEGVRVLMNARNENTLYKAVEKIRLAGGEAFGIAGDVSSPKQIETLFDTAKLVLGSPDILVVNAGGPPTGKAATLPDEAWAKGYELTLMSAVRLARAALPDMQANGWGRIINITSTSVKQPINNLPLSNSFRAAVTGFAKTLSKEVAARGITVNNVAPGYTDTERLNELFDTEEAKHAFAQSIPAKRLARAEEIASAVTFLASRQAGYITGQTIVVDGGFTGNVF
jgi:3-oxoacyl-[acyl-carrier protein] reductase